MQSKQIIEILDTDRYLNFLREYHGADPVKLALNKTLASKYPLRELSEILHLYHKAKHKLPLWVDNFCALNPKAYEQSSSEKTAKYKSTLLQGRRLLNLTGGLGVDDFYFAKAFDEVDSWDIDFQIHTMADYNLRKLKANNVSRLLGDAVSFLDKLEANHYDCVYIDPDRRPDAKGRTFYLEHTVPNIVDLQELLLQRVPTLLVKASPMLDIHRACEQLKAVSEVWVISVDNEVKELLFKCERGWCKNPVIHAVDLRKEGFKQFSSSDSETIIQSSEDVNGPAEYFIDLGASLIKSGLQKQYAKMLGIDLCFQNAGYGFLRRKDGLFGRVFQVVEQIEFSKKSMKHYLKGKNLEKANVAKRNFPISVAEIRTQFQIKTGGEDYLFFYKDDSGKKYALHARKV